MEIITWLWFSIKFIFYRFRLRFSLVHDFLIRQRVYNCVDRMLKCWTWELWFFTLLCPNCWHQKHINMTCKCRLCPSCGKPLADKWLNNIYSRLPQQLKYYHVTFTIPGKLWNFFLRYRNKWAINLLFSACRHTLLSFFMSKFNCIPWIISVNHTFWSDLKWNVHIHVLITAWWISFSSDKIRIDVSDKFFSYDLIKDKRRYHLISEIRPFIKNRLPFYLFPTAYYWYNLLPKLYSKSRYVHVRKAVEKSWDVVSYMGRYLKRPVIATSRIKSIKDNAITFEYTHKEPYEKRLASINILTFVWLIVRHIPDKHFKCVRYSGIFSYRCRAYYLDLINHHIPPTKDTPKPMPLPTLFRLRMIKSFGNDPYICSECNTEMTIFSMTLHKSFFHTQTTYFHAP